MKGPRDEAVEAEGPAPPPAAAVAEATSTPADEDNVEWLKACNRRQAREIVYLKEELDQLHMKLLKAEKNVCQLMLLVYNQAASSNAPLGAEELSLKLSQRASTPPAVGQLPERREAFGGALEPSKVTEQSTPQPKQRVSQPLQSTDEGMRIVKREYAASAPSARDSMAVAKKEGRDARMVTEMKPDCFPSLQPPPIKAVKEPVPTFLGVSAPKQADSGRKQQPSVGNTGVTLVREEASSTGMEQVLKRRKVDSSPEKADVDMKPLERDVPSLPPASPQVCWEKVDLSKKDIGAATRDVLSESRGRLLHKDWQKDHARAKLPVQSCSDDDAGCSFLSGQKRQRILSLLQGCSGEKEKVSTTMDAEMGAGCELLQAHKRARVLSLLQEQCRMLDQKKAAKICSAPSAKAPSSSSGCLLTNAIGFGPSEARDLSTSAGTEAASATVKVPSGKTKLAASTNSSTLKFTENSLIASSIPRAAPPEAMTSGSGAGDGDSRSLLSWPAVLQACMAMGSSDLAAAAARRAAASKSITMGAPQAVKERNFLLAKSDKEALDNEKKEAAMMYEKDSVGRQNIDNMNEEEEAKVCRLSLCCGSATGEERSRFGVQVNMVPKETDGREKTAELQLLAGKMLSCRQKDGMATPSVPRSMPGDEPASCNLKLNLASSTYEDPTVKGGEGNMPLELAVLRDQTNAKGKEVVEQEEENEESKLLSAEQWERLRALAVGGYEKRKGRPHVVRGALHYGAFLEACCSWAPGVWLSASALLAAYHRWASTSTGFAGASPEAFIKNLQQQAMILGPLGLELKKKHFHCGSRLRTVGMNYRGITLKDPQHLALATADLPGLSLSLTTTQDGDSETFAETENETETDTYVDTTEGTSADAALEDSSAADVAPPERMSLLPLKMEGIIAPTASKGLPSCVRRILDAVGCKSVPELAGGKTTSLMNGEEVVGDKDGMASSNLPDERHHPAKYPEQEGTSSEAKSSSPVPKDEDRASASHPHREDRFREVFLQGGGGSPAFARKSSLLASAHPKDDAQPLQEGPSSSTDHLTYCPIRKAINRLTAGHAPPLRASSVPKPQADANGFSSPVRPIAIRPPALFPPQAAPNGSEYHLNGNASLSLDSLDAESRMSVAANRASKSNALMKAKQIGQLPSAQTGAGHGKHQD